jgi:hypothetical protein
VRLDRELAEREAEAPPRPGLQGRFAFELGEFLEDAVSLIKSSRCRRTIS